MIQPHESVKCLTNGIRKEEVPSGDEGQQLSGRHVSVKVRRARFGHAGTELSVTQAGKDGRHRRNQEGQNDGGSRILFGHVAGHHVDPGAQRAPDTQRHQVEGVEAARQAGLVAGGVHHLDAHQLPPEALQGFWNHRAVGGMWTVGKTTHICTKVLGQHEKTPHITYCWWAS